MLAMRRPMKKLQAVAALFLATTGCATILTGTSQQITVNSNVNGARVMLNGSSIGVTPLTVRIAKRSNQVLTVEKRGYNPQTISMQTTTPTAFWGNILIGGLPGTTTDAASGALNEYSPNSYYASLSRVGGDDESKVERERFVLFVLNNYPRLTRELAAGRGPLVSACCELLGASDVVTCNRLTARLADEAKLHDDAMEFVTALTDSSPSESIQ